MTTPTSEEGKIVFNAAEFISGMVEQVGKHSPGEESLMDEVKHMIALTRDTAFDVDYLVITNQTLEMKQQELLTFLEKNFSTLDLDTIQAKLDEVGAENVKLKDELTELIEEMNI